MNVSFEKLADNTAKIVVNVEEADYASKVKKEIKHIGATHNIPGFRKGHVPEGQLIRMFGKEVKSNVINRTVFDEVIKYIQENKIDVLGEPMPVEVKEISMADKDYTFEYEIGIAPEININLEADTLSYYTIAVTEEMKADQDKALRERFGAQVPGEEFEENALVKGAIMELNEDGSVKETEDAIQVVAGIVAPMYFHDKDQAALFNGKKVGDKVVFNPAKAAGDNVAEIASMLNIDKNKAADVKADFELAISEIIVLRPAEHNEEFFKNVFGPDKVKTEEEYQAALADMISKSLAQNSTELFQRDTREALVEKYGNLDLPVAFLKKWLVARNEELTAENIDAEFEKMLPALKWELIRGALVRQLDIKVSEDELLEFAKMVAFQQFAQYGMTNLTPDIFEDYAKKMLADKNARAQMAERVGDNKLFNAIRGKVNLESKEVSLDEFRKLAAGEE